MYYSIMGLSSANPFENEFRIEERDSLHGFEYIYPGDGLLYQDDEYSSGSGRDWQPEDVKPADIERVLCDGIPRTGSGNLQKMSQSLLNRQFQQRRLTRQRLDSLLKGELQIERFDLITLGFLAASQREDDDPPERLRRYMDDMNAGLARCGMMKLYPVNPYEAFCMMCLLCDMPLLTYYDVWEMSFEEA